MSESLVLFRGCWVASCSVSSLSSCSLTLVLSWAWLDSAWAWRDPAQNFFRAKDTRIQSSDLIRSVMRIALKARAYSFIVSPFIASKSPILERVLNGGLVVLSVVVINAAIGFWQVEPFLQGSHGEHISPESLHDVPKVIVWLLPILGNHDREIPGRTRSGSFSVAVQQHNLSTNSLQGVQWSRLVRMSLFADGTGSKIYGLVTDQEPYLWQCAYPPCWGYRKANSHRGIAGGNAALLDDSSYLKTWSSGRNMVGPLVVRC